MMYVSHINVGTETPSPHLAFPSVITNIRGTKFPQTAQRTWLIFIRINQKKNLEDKKKKSTLLNHYVLLYFSLCFLSFFPSRRIELSHLFYLLDLGEQFCTLLLLWLKSFLCRKTVIYAKKKNKGGKMLAAWKIETNWKQILILMHFFFQ